MVRLQTSFLEADSREHEAAGQVSNRIRRESRDSLDGPLELWPRAALSDNLQGGDNPRPIRLRKNWVRFL